MPSIGNISAQTVLNASPFSKSCRTMIDDSRGLARELKRVFAESETPLERYHEKLGKLEARMKRAGFSATQMAAAMQRAGQVYKQEFGIGGGLLGLLNMPVTLGRGGLAGLIPGLGLRTLGVAAGGYMATRAIGHAITDVADIAGESRRLGIGVGPMQRLQYAAGRRGIEAETLTGGMETVSVRLSEAAHGIGKAKDVIDQLGLSAKSLAAMAPDKAFNVLADSIRQIRDPSEKLHVAARLFGDAGAKLLPMLELGSQGIGKLGQEADALGRVLSSTEVGAATRAKSAIRELNASFESLARTVAVRLAPAVTAVADIINGVLGGDRGTPKTAGDQYVTGQQGRYATNFVDRWLYNSEANRIAQRQAQQRLDNALRQGGRALTASDSEETGVGRQLGKLAGAMQGDGNWAWTRPQLEAELARVTALSETLQSTAEQTNLDKYIDQLKQAQSILASQEKSLRTFSETWKERYETSRLSPLDAALYQAKKMGAGWQTHQDIIAYYRNIEEADAKKQGAAFAGRFATPQDKFRKDLESLTTWRRMGAITEQQYRTALGGIEKDALTAMVPRGSQARLPSGAATYGSQAAYDIMARAGAGDPQKEVLAVAKQQLAVLKQEVAKEVQRIRENQEKGEQVQEAVF